MDPTSGVIYFLVIASMLWILKKIFNPDRLSHLPGPRGVPLLGNLLDIERYKLRISLHRWAKQYGGVFRVRLPIGDVVVVSSYEHIHRVLVGNGNAFAGRKDFFRVKFLNLDSGITSLQPDDPSWTHIRKVSHRYMKQFGDGMSRLEEILSQNANYMLQQIDANLGQPVDVMETLKATALRSISVLLLGRALEDDDTLLDLLLTFENGLLNALSMTLSSLLIDNFPFLVHVPLPASVCLKRFKAFHEECWAKIKDNQSKAKEESLTQVLLSNVSEAISEANPTRKGTISELEAAASSLILISAGTNTTTRAMYCILNVLAFKHEIQEKVHEEICKVLDDSKAMITVSDRAKMPYLRATIMECLRVFPPAPAGGMTHSPVRDTVLPGYGVIPKGTVMIINTWALHHDESFWKDPAVIRPERFLDDNGELLPPDHPNRKHVLPFGAGPRVCLGEVFARTRLFLWTSSVVGRYKIKPAPDSDEKWLDPTVHQESVVLEPLPNKIIFEKRN